MNANNKGLLGVLGLTILLAVGCSSVSRKAVSGLSQDQAEFRADRVANVTYDLRMELNRDRPDYEGSVQIKFDLTNAGDPLTVDFIGGKVVELSVNGTAVETPNYNNKFITLPAGNLRVGENQVVVKYSHPFSKTGSGLYRFKDPEDGRVYIYSDFEPFDANQLFPNFDQPDLKAKYTLTAVVPANWTVISAKREAKVESDRSGTRVWHFPETELFSTYIFSLHAGPYQVWESSAGNIPLRLFARRSFAQFVNAKEWFLITKQGFHFFQDYFDYEYPFGKYDQVIVPDFNSGAMENTAAVTFREGYFPKGTATRNQRERRASVILHEMAHMWFGNLVTMQWWDDLWLNESFATYMASLALAEATEFKDSWKEFYTGTKQWAYWEDNLVTRHPIVAQVNNTDDAFVNFDGITYGKGASVLKQLSYLLGPDNFRRGVRQYFKKYEWKNTRMKDFVATLGAASNTNLDTWTDQWLSTTGFNQIEAKYHCEDGKISSFGLVQNSEGDGNTMRIHRTKVGLFNKNDKGAVVLTRTVPVSYSKDQTFVPDLVGEACPDLVYPNVEDHDFVEVKLDPRTMKATGQLLTQVEDSTSRMMFWQSLWDMVRNTDISAWKYAELAFGHMPREMDIKISTETAQRMVSLIKFLPRDTEEDRQLRDRYIERAEAFYWGLLEGAAPGGDFQKLWFDTYTKLAKTEPALRRLVQLLNGQLRFRGLVVDQDRRWTAIKRLHEMNWPQANEIRQAEMRQDSSEQGTKAALAALVSLPSIDVKREWFSRITEKDSTVPLARLRVAMSNLFPEEQDDFEARFTDDYFRELVKMTTFKEDVFLSNYARYLTPSVCTPTNVRKLASFIDSNGALTPVVLKRIKVAHQEDGRCVRIRERASFAMQKKLNPEADTDTVSKKTDY